MGTGLYHDCFPEIEWGEIDSMVSKSILYSYVQCQILFPWFHTHFQLTGKT